MFTKILVPLDGSRLAEAALPPAELLAGVYGAELILLHVLERGAPSTVHGERHWTDERSATAYLEQLCRDVRARGALASVHVHEVPAGSVAGSIVDHAADMGADLIALCAHGHGRVRDALVGSVAQQVLQRGRAPVLVIPSRDGATPARAFVPRTILVPLDGTAAAETALELAADLARRLRAGVHLTMVVDTDQTVSGARAAVATMLPSATRALLGAEQLRADHYLDGMVDRLRASKVEAEAEVRRGSAAGQLVRDTDEHAPELVVMATRARAGLQALWDDSVAARLLARAAAPILLIRRTDS